DGGNNMTGGAGGSGGGGGGGGGAACAVGDVRGCSTAGYTAVCTEIGGPTRWFECKCKHGEIHVCTCPGVGGTGHQQSVSRSGSACFCRPWYSMQRRWPRW